MPYKFLFLLPAFLYAGTQLNSQEILEQLATKLTKEYESNAKELILLQTDKTVYRPGTEIWFRAFSVSSNGFATNEKNKVIYVELADAKDSVIGRVLLNKEELQYNGSVLIPSRVKEGFYQLRAYTKTASEQLPPGLFIYPVYITSDAGKMKVESQSSASEPICKFYVEGDELVNNVSCSVFFSATDKNGIPLQVSGTVKDNFGNEVAKFTGNGIGKFVFEPYSKDRTYKIYIKTNNPAEQAYSLPSIKTGAFQLSLQKQTADELVFRIALGDSAYTKKASSYLLGVAGGKVCFASSGSAMYMVNVPVNTLPNGVVDFYLFDANKELKSRRTVFNENYNSTISITADKPEYPSRQKAKLNLNVTDNEGKPVKAVMSVSVTDKRLVNERSPLHAADIYMLSRNTTGLMTEYFINNSEARDLFAVTLSSDNYLPFTPAIKANENFYWDGIEIRGSLADKQNNPVTGELIMLMPDQETTALNDSTDSKGFFDFRDIIFYGKKRFHVMVPSVYNKQQKYEIKINEITYPEIYSHTYLNNADVTSLKNLSAFKQQQADSSVSGNTKIWLQQLAMQEETGNKKNKASKDNGLLNGRRITGEQLDKLSLSNTADAVKMLPGVIMMGGRLTIRGGIQSLSGDLSDVEPLLILNGVNTRASSVIDYLNSIPPSQIDYIEVLTGPEAALYGTRGGNGAIVVKTTNELRDSNKDDKERQTIVASGFYKEQNFYEPPYDKYSVREASFTDNRATIYWNGQVMTDAAGKATVSFYTADLKNDYTVTVQGITEKGELIFKTYTIKKR